MKRTWLMLLLLAVAGGFFYASYDSPVVAQTGGTVADGAEVQTLGSIADANTPPRSMIGTIYDAFHRAIGSSSRHSAEIGQQMQAADDALSRIKLQNADALKRAGRQIRLKRCNTPNVVLIMADDLAVNQLGCYGQRLIQTPYIDRLASQGILFSQFYAGTSVDSPSRCSLMTGLHTGHCTIRGNTPLLPLRDNDVTMAEVMWNAGYSTGLIGKWALGNAGTTGIPTRQGFESFFGFLTREEAIDTYPDYLWRNEQQVFIHANANGARVQYGDDLLTQEALAYLSLSAGRPFFMNVNFTAPHIPWDVPTDAPYTKETWPQERKNLAARITRLDQHVGMIMQRLVDLGIDQNTLIILTSDNGADMSEFEASSFVAARPLRGAKGDLFEGGVVVPFIARWPGRIAPAQVCNIPFAAWDVLPTLAEIVGALSIPQHLDGVSFLTALLGGVPAGNRYLYWELHEDGFAQAVRFGDWKGIRTAPDEPLQIYHLTTDIGEETNVIERVPEIANQIEAIMRKAHIDSPTWSIKP